MKYLLFCFICIFENVLVSCVNLKRWEMQPATVTPRPSNHLLSQWPLFHPEKALSSPWSCQSHICCWSFKYLFLFLELMLVGLQLGDGVMCMCVFVYVCESLGALRKTPKAWIYPHSVACSLELKQTWFDCCLQTPGYSCSRACKWRICTLAGPQIS